MRDGRSDLRSDEPVVLAARPPRWRRRLWPQSVVGITLLVLAFSIGTAFSGTVMYSYYDYQLAKTDKKVSDEISAFGPTMETGRNNMTAAASAATKGIDQQLEPLRQFRTDGAMIQDVGKQLAPSVFEVATQDDAGQTVLATAFAVASDANQTFLLTSFNAVKATVYRPGPDLTVIQGATKINASVYTWDEAHDLALIIIEKGNVPKVAARADTDAVQIGERVFAVSAVGSTGATVAEGFVGDVSADGIQHSAPIGPTFQGAPIVDSDGKLIAIGSRVYAPYNFATDAMWIGVPPTAMCATVLRCPNGSPTAPGDQR
jgi:S1-C subfamily serine protease